MGPIENVPHTPKRGRPLHPLTQRMRSMEVGDSFLAEDWNELMMAKSWQCKLRPKRFSIMKEAHLGWRVWRLE